MKKLNFQKDFSKTIIDNNDVDKDHNNHHNRPSTFEMMRQQKNTTNNIITWSSNFDKTIIIDQQKQHVFSSTLFFQREAFHKWNQYNPNRVVLLMEEILHHLGCIKPCK